MNNFVTCINNDNVIEVILLLLFVTSQESQIKQNSDIQIKLERPQSKPRVEATRRPHPPCSASCRAAPVPTRHRPAGQPVSIAGQSAMRTSISITDSLTHRQPFEIHNSNRSHFLNSY